METLKLVLELLTLGVDVAIIVVLVKILKEYKKK